MSDLTTRSREAAQRDLAVAALESICEGISDAHDSATELGGAYRTIAGTALWRIAEIGATAPPVEKRAERQIEALDAAWGEVCERREREARAAAIEEAARVAEHGYVQYAGDIRVGLAAEIRALAAAPQESAP